MLTIQQDAATTQPPSAASAAPSLGSLDVAEWQKFVESHPDSTVFHHRNWIETIQSHYGLSSYFPCLRSGDEVIAAMPFLSCRSLLGATRLLSLPYSDYLRILSRRPHAAEQLVNALKVDHPACDSMRLRTDTPLADVRCNSDVVRHEVSLQLPAARLLKNVKPSIHRNVKKAQRAELNFVRRTDGEAMAEFYQLHALTRRKLGVPVQPKSFFERLQKQVIDAGLGHVGLVMKAQHAAAAGVFLTFNGTVTYKYAASHPAALADRPNDFLVFHSLLLAAEEGFRAFDFGVSKRKHEGLCRFKRHWGAQEIDVDTVQIVGCERQPKDESSVFKLANLIIRNSPVFVCRFLGEVFYRFAN